MFADDITEKLATVLHQHQHRIVFAESCTAGLIAASLGRIPGVSNVLAGSAVVYQVDTKVAWLDINPQITAEYGVVSEKVSEAMAAGVLDKTPHASVAASITGHLGPNAPAELDGVAWTCVSYRIGSRTHASTKRLALQTASEASMTAIEIRRHRQFEAARQVIEFTLNCLENSTATSPV